MSALPTAPCSTRPVIEFHQVGPDVVAEALSFIDVQTLWAAERVCRTWRNILSANNETFWKKRCLNLGCLGSESSTKTEKQFDEEGAEGPATKRAKKTVNYKLLTKPLLGKVYFNETPYMSHCPKTGIGLSPYRIERWGVSHAEPCISILASNEESRRESTEPTKHLLPSNQGSWQDYYSKLPEPFPYELPIRLFINRNGSYKNNEEKIQLLYKRKLIILTCTFHFREGIPARDFAESLQARVNIHVETNLINARDFAVSKEEAMTCTATWISSD